MDWFVLLTPLLMLGVIALVRFVGCNQLFDLEETELLLDPPTNLQPFPADHRMNLTWDYKDRKHGSADRFAVFFKVDGGTYQEYGDAGITWITTETGQHARASITGLDNDILHYFKVKAWIGSNDSSDSQEVSATPAATAFLERNTTPAMPRNDFNGWVGMQVQPRADLLVTQLGRWVVDGNGTHDMIIVDPYPNPTPQDPAPLPNKELGRVTISINPLVDPVDKFKFEPLAAPVQLIAFHLYYFVTRENTSGDHWLDFAQTVQVVGKTVDNIPIGEIISGVYLPDGPNQNYAFSGSANYTYGPVNFKY